MKLQEAITKRQYENIAKSIFDARNREFDDDSDELCGDKELIDSVQEEITTNVDEEGYSNGRIIIIQCGSEMSEQDLGGDDLVSVVQDTLNALEKGYMVHTYYGDNTETVIYGIK